MKNINDYAKKVLAITKSKKFPKDTIEQQIPGLYNGISAFSNDVRLNEKKETEKRFAAILVNLLHVGNTLKIDADQALAKRIKEIEKCHGVCKRK